MLEIPYGTLSEGGDFSTAADFSQSRGLSTEAFEALPRVRFEAPRHGATSTPHPARRTPSCWHPSGPHTFWGSAASEIGAPARFSSDAAHLSVCAGAEALAGLPVGDLKRLMEAHGVPDAGCIEKAHLVEALLDCFARPRQAASLSLPSIVQPAACAICMSGFKEGDLLRQLGCSELHARPC